MLDCLQSNITRPHQVLLEVGYGNFFSSPGVNDHHARVVRGGDGQGEGGGAPGGGVGKFFTSFNEETRSTARCAPLICPRLDLYPLFNIELIRVDFPSPVSPTTISVNSNPFFTDLR